MSRVSSVIKSLPIVITMGEPAGIGGEITCKAWLRRHEGLTPFFVIDDPKRLRAMSGRLQALRERIPVQVISTPADAMTVFTHALPVLPESLAVESVPGQPMLANTKAVITSIERAVALVRHGHCAAVVTNPICKKILYAAKFPYPGHTEFLATLAGPNIRHTMMLTCPGLRVVPVTIHLSLRQAVAILNTDDIITCGRITTIALQQDFGISKPRLAVAALNPHAGEGSTLGVEEEKVIRPAVTNLSKNGIHAFGPVPADALFHAKARACYDAVLCMYHDQAMIPLKMIGFYNGVNITLGLPFVRTAPDHGTALDIAGTGKASESSLMQALRIARKLSTRRMISYL